MLVLLARFRSNVRLETTWHRATRDYLNVESSAGLPFVATRRTRGVLLLTAPMLAVMSLVLLDTMGQWDRASRGAHVVPRFGAGARAEYATRCVTRTS